MAKWDIVGVLVLWMLELAVNQSWAKCNICGGLSKGENIDLEDYLDTPENRRKEQFSTSSSRRYGLHSRNRLLARNKYHPQVPHGPRAYQSAQSNLFPQEYQDQRPALPYNNHHANVYPQGPPNPNGNVYPQGPPNPHGNVYPQGPPNPHANRFGQPPNVPVPNQFNHNPVNHHPYQRPQFNPQNVHIPNSNPLPRHPPHPFPPAPFSPPGDNPPINGQFPPVPNHPPPVPEHPPHVGNPFVPHGRHPLPNPQSAPPENVPNLPAPLGPSPEFNQPVLPHVPPPVFPPAALPPPHTQGVVKAQWRSIQRYGPYHDGHAQTYFNGDYGNLGSVGSTGHVSFGTEINTGHSHQHSHLYRVFG